MRNLNDFVSALVSRLNDEGIESELRSGYNVHHCRLSIYGIKYDVNLTPGTSIVTFQRQEFIPDERTGQYDIDKALELLKSF